jgi:hypothetical protein
MTNEVPHFLKHIARIYPCRSRFQQSCHDDSLGSTIQPSVAEAAVHERGMRRDDSMHRQPDNVPQDQ